MPKHNQPLQLLGKLSAEQFLAEYWQKKPLLVRQAIPQFSSPLTSDELAGLAMEETIESRIIVEHGKNNPWELMRGPFDEEHFQNLPETHWTLLIQQLDAWSPEINELKQHFQFIPNWRVDDIMASYAPKGGSVGPHFDYYDVFLIQAHGERHWRTGQYCDETSARLQDTSLSILEHFEEDESWILKPGDMLYLPPKLAHFGIAQNDCITLSVGFRAPTHQQILSHFTDYLLDQMAGQNFYEDPDLKPQEHCGEISREALIKFKEIIESQLSNESKLESWFGKYITEPKNEHTIQVQDVPYLEADLQQIIDNNYTIFTNEGSRFAYALNSNVLNFYVDGDNFALKPEDVKIVQTICELGSFPAKQIISREPESETFGLILGLLNNGSLYCSHE